MELYWNGETVCFFYRSMDRLFVRAFQTREAAISASSNEKFHLARSNVHKSVKIPKLGGRGSNKEATDENCVIMDVITWITDNSGVTTGGWKEGG